MTKRKKSKGYFENYARPGAQIDQEREKKEEEKMDIGAKLDIYWPHAPPYKINRRSHACPRYLYVQSTF